MRRTLWIAILAGVVALAGAACAGEDEGVPASVAGNTEEIITQLEHDWVAAINNKDVSAIERLLADDFAGATEDMQYSKAYALEDVEFGSHSLEMTDLDVRVFGNTAVTTFEQAETSTHGDDAFTGRYRFTNVWVRQDDGSWRAVASHGSRIR